MNKQNLYCQHAACSFLYQIDGFVEAYNENEQEKDQQLSTQTLQTQSMCI